MWTWILLWTPYRLNAEVARRVMPSMIYAVVALTSINAPNLPVTDTNSSAASPAHFSRRPCISPERGAESRIHRSVSKQSQDHSVRHVLLADSDPSVAAAQMPACTAVDRPYRSCCSLLEMSVFPSQCI
ncbi:uncharacterized protein BO80DRAFT_209034 [Aspergillus ibericus CBS 121593]|uniref:Secreted protein n=1 Tax=Aspergillus ibericus CBS 121593 TaxID=1448316 RepID=A0A395HA54_9EURO|nr:hypothetical protein BO80DRAFT_209034 [Aspergillus ibericus CBS 121593]RAL04797.1 hypothetical protein BO80DRAFT_209034 [Aspergillus ibericus CBS 121593]